MNEPSDLSALSGLASELASTFVALSSDIAIVIGADGAVREVVQGSAPIAPGAGAWVGKPWADTVTRDTRAKIEQLLDDVHSTGKGRQREVNLPSTEGPTIPVSYAAIRLGEHGPVLAVGRDLRAIAAIQQRFAESQQEMERDYWKRRQAESRYRMLFQVATDAVIVVDALTMSIVEANRAAAQLFGIAQAELVGKHATVGMDRHSWPAVEELLTSTRTTGRAAEIRARLPEGGGPIDVSATPFRSDRDLLLLVRARVPTHRRLAAQPESPAQSESQAQWADLVRRIPDAVVITDSAGRVLMANPAFVELCQLRDAAQGEGRELAAWIGSDAASSLIAQVKLHGIATRAAAALRGESARSIGVGISAALLDDGDSEYIGFTIRRLEAGGVSDAGDGKAAALPAVEDVAVAIEALASLMGRQPLPELLRAATALTERHLIRTALQRSAGDAHAASVLLGVTPQMLAERLALHDIAPGGDGASQTQLN